MVSRVTVRGLAVVGVLVLVVAALAHLMGMSKSSLFGVSGVVLVGYSYALYAVGEWYGRKAVSSSVE